MRPQHTIALNEIKADFSNVYNLDDPREYFRSLSGNDYIIPHIARDVFLQLIDSRDEAHRKTLNIIDIGCSYGLNAALLKRHLNWDMLVARQTLPGMMLLPSVVLQRLDRLFLESWPLRERIRMIGIDIAERAIAYANAIGALDIGFPVDLENEDMPQRLRREVETADLIVSTGCIGYVTERSFSRIALAMADQQRKPWVASFVLRAVDYSRIARELSRAGLVTEKLEGITFVQRRFADVAEMEATLEILRRRGIDPSFHEARGLMHAELYLSRPPEDIQKRPLDQLVRVSAGLNKPHQIAAETLCGSMIKNPG
jgi:SAM-dependent methyltransferase